MEHTTSREKRVKKAGIPTNRQGGATNIALKRRKKKYPQLEKENHSKRSKNLKHLGRKKRRKAQKTKPKGGRGSKTTKKNGKKGSILF